MDDCIFCKIIKGDAKSDKVYEDDEVLAFHDISPQAPVHVLIVPKKHIKNLTEADKTDQGVLGKIQLVAKNIADDLGVFSAFRVMVANGGGAGQSVFHLHYHLMGGWDKKTPPMEKDPDKFP